MSRILTCLSSDVPHLLRCFSSRTLQRVLHPLPSNATPTYVARNAVSAPVVRSLCQHSNSTTTEATTSLASPTSTQPPGRMVIIRHHFLS